MAKSGPLTARTNLQVLLVLVIGSCVASALPSSIPDGPSSGVSSMKRDDNKLAAILIDNNESDLDNKLFPYEPLAYVPARDSAANREQRRHNTIHSLLMPAVTTGGADLEREASNVAPTSTSSNDKTGGAPSVKPLTTSAADEQAKLFDKIRTIAFNSREVRLVGPDQKEVEMKDDLATKMMIAIDNLQKEATEVWGQVNEKLDKGWTELKTMVEGAVAPSSKSPAAGRQLRDTSGTSSFKPVPVSDLDGYSMADEPTDLKGAAETTGSKIKGFLSNIGLNEDNQKKASEALSKAGTSVSETMTKDLPDALKKASDAVGETVTKDIPNAFKNIFG